MSLSDIIGEFDKEQNVTSEQLAQTLQSKDNLPLKTEIPFSPEVWHTALRKDACYLVGDLFNNLKIMQKDQEGKVSLEKPSYTAVNEKGETVQISFGEKLTVSLLRQIGFSEEYAVSHKRKGRAEMVSVLARKVEQQQKSSDALGKVMGK